MCHFHVLNPPDAKMMGHSPACLSAVPSVLEALLNNPGYLGTSWGHDTLKLVGRELIPVATKAEKCYETILEFVQLQVENASL